MLWYVHYKESYRNYLKYDQRCSKMRQLTVKISNNRASEFYYRIVLLYPIQHCELDLSFLLGYCSCSLMWKPSCKGSQPCSYWGSCATQIVQLKSFTLQIVECNLYTKKLVIQHVARWHTFHTMVFVKTFHVFASTLLKIRDGKYAPFDILLYIKILEIMDF